MKLDEILKLENKEFRLESANISLVNRGNQSFVIVGPGLIEMLPTGILQATILTNNCDSDLLHKNLNERTENKIIKDETYFDLELIDFNGNYWTSERILINSWNQMNISGYYFKCKLSSIRKEHERNVKLSLFIFHVSHKHKIPVNLYENFPGGGFSLNHRIIYFDDIRIKIKKFDKYYTISIKDPNGGYAYKDAKTVLETISLATGTYIHPFAGEFYENGINSNVVYANRGDAHSSMAIMKCDDEPWNKSLDLFVVACLMSSKSKPFQDLFSHWVNIHSSFKAGFTIYASCICIGIEGILKSNFEMFGLPDESIVAEANESIEIIDTDARISIVAKNITKSSLRNACIFKTKTALHCFEAKNIIAKNEISAWNSIRNQMVHADTLEDSTEAFQKIMDKTFLCLNIFHKTLLTAIGYSGQYLDYSEGQKEVYFKHPFIEAEINGIQTLLRPFIELRFLQKQ